YKRLHTPRLGHVAESSGTKLRKGVLVANDRLNGCDEYVRLDRVLRADRDSRTRRRNSTNGLLHTLERSSKICAGLHLGNCGRETIDRRRIFVSDAVERPCDPARFTQRLYEYCIVTPLFGAQSLGQCIAQAYEILEPGGIPGDDCRNEVGLDGRLRHDIVLTRHE